MSSGILNITESNAELVKLPRKPPAPNHPWRRSIKDWQTKKLNDLSEERNGRWLNDWKPPNYTTVLWTKEFYSIDELQRFGYKIDKDESKVEKLKRHHYKFN